MAQDSDVMQRPAGEALQPADGEPTRFTVSVRVNGDAHRLELDTRVTLLDTLRDALGLTGTKKACDRGECGACTVHIDGRRALSCMTLAVLADGKQVTTIEGLARNGQLRAITPDAIGIHRA